MKLLMVLVAAWIVIVSIVSAVPITGVATGISSNGFNVSATGVTGTEAWVMWGDYTGMENWASVPATSVAGTANITVLGAPIYGGEYIYYQACDETGCGNELTISITSITPMPTTTHGILMRNITKSRFDPLVITQSLWSGYTQVTPSTVVFSIALMFFMIGIWFRTKSVRLIAVVGILISPFVMFGSQGLYLGIPSIGIGIAQGLLAAGLCGIMFSFARK